ncbi:MAG: elongation factor G [Planctomycetes bacterium]|nr:elongation factor G [Planctomycetota bacterium]
MDLARVRNIGIAAHIDAGKTTVSERILFDSGVEHRMGNVDEGTTVLDWMQEERERGITITAAATALPWKGCHLNLIDTPGHVDFTIEVERCMRVLDGAVLVLDAVMGVQAQSETVWRQMRRHHVPYLVFVNKLDRPGADFLRVAGNLKQRLGVRAIPVQYPLVEAGRVRGVVDLVTGLTWESRGAERAAEPRPLELPAEGRDEVGVLRAELFEALAEEDEELTGILLDGGTPAPEKCVRALRKRTLAGTLVPILCGVALENIGIQALLDAVVDYLPSPLDKPPVEGLDPENGERVLRGSRNEEPLAALAFKLQSQAHGELCFVRIYSGRIRPGDSLWNPRVRRFEKVARVMRMHANAGEALSEAGAGDIVALTGFKQTATGDTLCIRDAPIVLERLEFPEPVISLVIEPAQSGDRDKLHAALARMAHEDPSFHAREDGETGQWIISGMGELHLEVAQHRLVTDFHVTARVGTPRVAYREAPRQSATGRVELERTLGSREVFGCVELEVRPAQESAPAALEWAPDCPIPQAFRHAIAETLRLDTQVGPRFGYPLARIALRVVGGKSDPRRDAEMAFTQAANQALREALENSAVCLLEPLMSFEIQTPSEFSSGIIADLNSRRAEINDVEAEGALRTLHGTVALSKMFGYSTAVRSLSQGRAGFSMIPAGHCEVPEAELQARGLVWS